MECSFFSSLTAHHIATPLQPAFARGLVAFLVSIARLLPYTINSKSGCWVKNFFISYNKADREWAQWLDWFVRSKGLTTFTQFNDIPWGSNFVSRMDEGLKQAERLILVLSPDFLSSVFTEAEWTTIFAKDPDGSKRLMLPIRLFSHTR